MGKPKNKTPRPGKKIKPTHRLICKPNHIGCTVERIEDDK